jgi:dTDP-4-amino-4,6-dideoxygalactose transaminase
MNRHDRVDRTPIPFIDVAAQRRRLGGRIDAAVSRVLEHCQFILGPEVRALEAALAEFCGARHVVTCASGTDALALVLMARGIGPGDAVICPSFTFCATAEAVALLGATPVFADVDAATFNISPESALRAVAAARRAGLAPRMIIPVDLFGLPADYPAINALAAAEKLFVLDDAAQGFGGVAGNRNIGTLADATATSFFPAKPLGCYGDGGAIFTDDDGLAEVMGIVESLPESLRDMLKRKLKCGDLELGDLYNHIFDESRPGPLRQKQLERLAEHYEYAEYAVRSAPGV